MIRKLVAAWAFVSWTGIAAPSAALLLINNGLAPPNPDNVITTDPGEPVFVQAASCDATVSYPCASPGAQTTVQWNTSASQSINVFENSRLILGPGADIPFPGSEPACAHEDAEIVVDGALNAYVVAGEPGSCNGYELPRGTVTVESGNAYVHAYDGDVVVRGGTAQVILSGIHHGSASVSIEGGDVSLGTYIVGGSVEITGGTINDLKVQDGLVFIRGGNIAAPIQIGPLSSPAFSTVVVHGSNFKINGNLARNGPVNVTSGRLKGKLESGEAIDQDFEITPPGTLILEADPPPPGVPIPLPGIAVLSLIVLGVAGLALRPPRVAL